MVVEVWGGKTEIVICKFGLPYDLLFPAQEVLGGSWSQALTELRTYTYEIGTDDVVVGRKKVGGNARGSSSRRLDQRLELPLY